MRKKTTSGPKHSSPSSSKQAAARVLHSNQKTSALSSRKRPRQQRSKEMVEAILQAAAEIFAELGYAAATTNKIAKRAGVSVGSLYQYFPNKDSLLSELFKQHHEDIKVVLTPALMRLADPQVPLKDALKGMLSDLVGLHNANPALTKALSTAVVSQSPAMEHVHNDEDDYHDLVTSMFKRRAEVRQDNHLAMALIMGQITQYLTRWLVHDAPAQIPTEELLDEAVYLMERYLRYP